MNKWIIGFLGLFYASFASSQIDIKNIFDSAKKIFESNAQQPADVGGGSSQSQSPSTRAQAVADYRKVVEGLAQRGDLRKKDFPYLPDTRFPYIEFTDSSMPDIYALRMLPDESLIKKDPMNVLMFWQTLILFPKGGAGFIGNDGSGNKKPPQSWVAYDSSSASYKTGEDARPFVQQMLQIMDTSKLPKVGSGKTAFLYHASVECPFCVKIEDQLRNSGISYRISPTALSPNPGEHYVHRIYCSSDPLAEWTKFLRQKEKPKIKNWFCEPTIRPVYTIKDLELIFGIPGTPAFFFADGTTIFGSDKLPQVFQKAREMESRGVVFQ